MPEIQISDEEIIGALTRALIRRWKACIAVIAVFVGLIIAGGSLVYSDARAKTATTMMQLFNDISKAKENANRWMKTAEEEVNVARKELSRASDALKDNINEFNKIIEESYQIYEQQQEKMKIQQQIIDEPATVDRKKLEKFEKLQIQRKKLDRPKLKGF